MLIEKKEMTFDVTTSKNCIEFLVQRQFIANEDEKVVLFVVYAMLTGGRSMRLGLKEKEKKIFDQVFVGGAGDAAWWGHNSTVMENVTGGLDVAAHKDFIIS